MNIVHRKTFWAGVGLCLTGLVPVGLILVLYSVGVFD